MRQGVRLGIDVGRARIGVARSDRDGLLATPVETVARTWAADVEPVQSQDLQRLLALITELEPVEVIVGLPLSLSGGHTPSTQDALDFAHALAQVTSVPIRLVDERLTTTSAQSAMRTTGRSTRKQKPVIDQAAAVILLQHALDSERSTGREPGQALT